MGFNNTNANVANSNSVILAASNSRRYVSITNDSSVDIYLGFGANAVANKGVLIKAGGGSFTSDNRNLCSSAINGIAASGPTNNVAVLEELA